jgi:hypothetical protein
MSQATAVKVWLPAAADALCSFSANSEDGSRGPAQAFKALVQTNAIARCALASPADREAMVNAPKEEWDLTLYTSLTENHAKTIGDAFRAKYGVDHPFLTADNPDPGMGERPIAPRGSALGRHARLDPQTCAQVGKHNRKLPQEAGVDDARYAKLVMEGLVCEAAVGPSARESATEE